MTPGTGGFITQAKSKAAKYCSYRERAPSQVLEKLIDWGLDEVTAQKLLKELVDENFLNEDRFCKAFCHDKFEFNQWGKKKIEMELRKYKLPPECVAEGLNAINPERYEKALADLASKKWDSLKSESNLWKRKNKTAMYLARKGFENDKVWSAVSDLSS